MHAEGFNNSAVPYASRRQTRPSIRRQASSCCDLDSCAQCVAAASCRVDAQELLASSSSGTSSQQGLKGRVICSYTCLMQLTREEVHIGVELALDEILIIQSHLLKLKSNLQKHRSVWTSTVALEG